MRHFGLFSNTVNDILKLILATLIHYAMHHMQNDLTCVFTKVHDKWRGNGLL